MNKCAKIISLVTASMNSNNLINIMQFQNNWRSTLSLRCLNLVVFDNSAFIVSYHHIQFFKHWHLRISLLDIILLNCRITTYAHFKFGHFIVILKSFFIQFVEASILEIRKKVVLIVLFLSLLLIESDEIIQSPVLMLIYSNKSNIISTSKIKFIIIEFTVNKEIWLVNM